MIKKSIALLCVLTLLVGLLPTGTVAAVSEEATAQQYLVGYAIRDINPYDANGNLYDVKLTGNGDDSNRACTGLMDDNGDGFVDGNDGLFTTCVCITDYLGNTVMIISADLLKGYSTFVNGARNKIIERLAQENNVTITADKIMVTGSHTHSGPSENKAYVEEAYIEKISDQMADAAVAAYNDRALATMKRGSVNAKEATKQLYKKPGFEGYEMNFIRQYDVTVSNGSSQKQFVIDSSLGSGAIEDYELSNGPDSVYEADHTMHLLTFEFDAANKDPIVMLNWSAHPTTNSGVDTSKASSDYVGSLRYNLALEGYRAAFVQGAGANTVISHRNSSIKDWAEQVQTDESKTNVYGKMLAKIALYGIENGGMTDALPALEIENQQKTFEGNIQTYDEAYGEAAEYAYQSAKDPTMTPVKYPYKHTNGKIINSSEQMAQIRNRRNEVARGTTTRRQEINVISLGRSALFVTAPNELADYYNKDVNNAVRANGTNNKWSELVDDSYGMPFVISNANDNQGYLPNALSYDYNNHLSTDLSPGSYEANTSYFARGTGEQLLDTYKEMIVEIDKKDAKCEACGGEIKTWTPIYAETATSDIAWDGHYYIMEDMTNFQVGTLNSGKTACIDLNGKEITCANRFFTTNRIAANGAALNIFDTVGGATVTGKATGNNPQGGLFMIQPGYSLSIYGGTFQFTNNSSIASSTSRGGVAFMHGTLNLYGGTIEGANVYCSEAEGVLTRGSGGAVYLSSSGKLYAYGGTITSGNAASNMGHCVFVDDGGKIILSGEAEIDDVYCRDIEDPEDEEFHFAGTVTVSGAYAGTVQLTLNSTDPTAIANAMDIGKAEDNADINKATIRVVTEPQRDWTARIDGSDLRLYGIADTTVALIGNTEYSSLTDALNAYNGTAVKLVRDVADAVNVAKDAYLDLNGHSITGVLTVADEMTLYCMDTQTDDYTIDDENGYGKLTNVSDEDLEQIKGVDNFNTEDSYGYLMITEPDGVSFHRVCLDINAVSLRPSQAGIYYTSAFQGDELVAENVSQFGVVLSVEKEPTEENMKRTGTYSRYENFAAGTDGNADITGTLLKGIMKANNSAFTNSRNANMQIYGRPYIQTKDGYLLGIAKNISLKEFVGNRDNAWDNLPNDEKTSLITMYQTYTNVMDDWELTNIPKAAQ